METVTRGNFYLGKILSKHIIISVLSYGLSWRQALEVLYKASPLSRRLIIKNFNIIKNILRRAKTKYYTYNKPYKEETICWDE
jgi:hypothetical protein